MKSKVHNGYIELYLLDENKKMGHDQYLLDMKEYDAKMEEYTRKNKEYENKLKIYEANVESAKIEANARYKKACQIAIDKAEAENRYNNATNQQTTVLGAVLQGVGNAINTASATAGIKEETYINQVLGERGLVTPPAKPYNPAPRKPTEPETGYYWQAYAFKSPNPYTKVAYNDIAYDGGFADVEKNGKYGLIDSYFNEIVPCTNSSRVKQKSFTDNRLLVKANGKYGVINSKGEFVIPIEYSSIEYNDNANLFKVCKKAKYGLISYTGQEVIPCQFDEMKESNGYQLCKMNSKWGIYTNDYKELYPCLFQDLNIQNINGGMVVYTKLNGLWGLINFNNGEQLIPNNYTEISTYKINDNRDGFLVKLDSAQGIYSAKGYVLLPCEFSKIKQGSNDGKIYFMVNDMHGKCGLYNTQGIPIIPVGKYTGYKGIKNSKDLMVKDHEKFGICSQYGTEMIPCMYKQLVYLENLNAYLAEKIINGQSYLGLISGKNTEIVPFMQVQGIDGQGFTQPYVLVKQVNSDKNSWGAIDYNGKIIVKMTNNKENAIKKALHSISNNESYFTSCYLDKMNMLKADNKTIAEERNKARTLYTSFSFYAKNYVGRLINEWQKKNEFESMSEYQTRVNPESRNQKIYAYTKDAQENYIAYSSARLPADNMVIVGNYDPDNQTYKLKSAYSKKELLVEVDREDAKEFKTSFNSIRRVPTFFVEDDTLGLAEYAFYMPNGRCYKYNNQNSLVHDIPEVKYEELDVSTLDIGYGTSDVDVNIPINMNKQENTFVVIIANENYQHDPKVDFAFNDGQAVKKYCINTLGIPETNVHLKANATLGEMRFQINWLRQTASAFDEDARFIFYYIGHGVPSDDMKDVCLLPVDGDGTDYNSGYKRSELFKTFGEFKGEVLVFMDACFSGVQRSGEAMASTRGVARTPSILMPTGNTVVFSASSGSETAHPYKKKIHGMFTYFFLQTLQSSTGSLTLGELVDNVTRNVSQKCIVENNKPQTPNLTHSLSKANWRSIIFKQ